MKDEKLKKRKKRKKKHYLLKLVVLILLGIGIYYFLTSDLFDIQVLTVENNKYYTAQQIISLAEAKTGGNLFEISTSDMKDNLLEDPYIKSVKVSRKLPDQIIFTVLERYEAAAIPYGNHYIIIDNEGMVLRQTDVEQTLTLLIGMTLSNIEPGTPLQVEETSVLNGTLKLLDAMEINEIFFKKIELSTIVIKAYIYDTLTCEGTPENIMKNMDGLKDVLYDLYVKGIERGVIKVGGDGYFSFSPLVE
jgi:cell division protein FtsQ